MKHYRLFLMLTIVLSLTLLTSPAFSQGDEPQPPALKPPETGEAITAQPEELSIYGEVQAVNQASNFMSVQYYDYDSDEEKIIEISLDKDTTLENAAKLDEIKQNDWVDVTYSVSDGKNIAKSIIVEKEEEIPSEMPERAAPKILEEE